MKRVTVSIAEELLRMVDERRGMVPRSRWICSLLKDSLEQIGASGGQT